MTGLASRYTLAALLTLGAAIHAQDIDFTNSIEPIFHRKCYACHSAAQQMNGVRLDDRSAALKGGYSGPVITPGDAAASKLVMRVSSEKAGFRMPPVGSRLTDAEIATIRAWIDQGAKWPERARAAVPPATTEQKHWSLLPVGKPAPPQPPNRTWGSNPIDAFILAAEPPGVQPSPAADKSTLLRRVTFDLIGLPPSVEELRAFLADDRPDAYERVVDGLLESPHYGERWARKWLDLARYADSDGYEKDLPRRWAWRWRQWVIDALNSDMPFDRFTVLQLAGDLLPHATVDDRVATGFYRNTLKNREGGVKREQTFFEETLDRANTVGTVWLGLTVGCAQCHDHKYDPISQKDYYQLHAFFDNLEEDTIDAPMAGEMGPYLQKRTEYMAKRQELLDTYHVTELMPPWEEKLRLAAKNPGKWPDWDLSYDVLFQMTDGGEKFLQLDPRKRTFKQQEMLTDYFIDWYSFVVPKARADELKLRELKGKLRDLKQSYPQLSQAAVVLESQDRHPSYLRVRGDYQRNGIEVQPASLSALPPLRSDHRPTRLDLARWIVARDNPLTARVAVNHMWEEFFGRGLVRTSEDFGRQGEKPSHPELLDWLATNFMEHGWKIKRMHKLIVTSATYRQSSQARPELRDRDPENAWLARQNRLRLPAEAIRDAALSASGLLYPAVGGKSVFPPQPAGVADLTYAWDAERWKESQGPDRYRRGLYIFFQRTAPYPQLINFDAPDANVTAPRRTRSDTPLQALNLMNDPVFVEAAQALALRILAEAPADFDRRLDYGYQLCFSRLPGPAERRIATTSFRRFKSILDRDGKGVQKLVPVARPDADPVETAAWVSLCRAWLNTDEFVTRE
jgi:mono/diheme cytochrome c family protein